MSYKLMISVVILRGEFESEEWCYIIHITSTGSYEYNTPYIIRYYAIFTYLCLRLRYGGVVVRCFAHYTIQCGTYINCHVVTVLVPYVLWSSWRES